MDATEHGLTEPTSVASRFPDTLWSIVLTAGAADGSRAADALAQLCATYRQPIYHWLRNTGYDHNQAEEAAQDFILHLLQRQRLPALSPQGPRFRVWLLTCLRHQLRDRRGAALAAKRGGGLPHVPLHQLEVAAPDGVPDRLFDRHFAAAVHERVLNSVRIGWQQPGDPARWAALRPFILAAPEGQEYRAAGQPLGLTPQQVKRMVFRLRAQYFDAFRAEVAVTVAPEDLAGELRHLVSFLPDLG